MTILIGKKGFHAQIYAENEKDFRRVTQYYCTSEDGRNESLEKEVDNKDPLA